MTGTDFWAAFSFLIANGLVRQPREGPPRDFRNPELVMIGVAFSLRFERDGWHIFVEVGDNAEGWHKLEHVLEFVDSSVTPQQLGQPPDLSVMAQVLQRNWDKVTSLFSEPDKTVRLRAFADAKTAALLELLRSVSP